MKTQGFTLMEILAVLLILAVVASFAVPMVRRVRDEVRYQQARSAALKMADAIRSYYQNTRGYYPVGCIGSGDGCEKLTITTADAACTDVAATGIPASATTKTVNIKQLFACDYLSVKDFAGLPYTFAQPNSPIDADVLVTVTGEAAANKYANKYFNVYRDMSLSAEASAKN